MNYLLSISCFNKSIDIEIVQKLVLGYAAPSSGYGAYSARSGEGVSDEKSLSFGCLMMDKEWVN